MRRCSSNDWLDEKGSKSNWNGGGLKRIEGACVWEKQWKAKLSSWRVTSWCGAIWEGRSHELRRTLLAAFEFSFFFIQLLLLIPLLTLLILPNLCNPSKHLPRIEINIKSLQDRPVLFYPSFCQVENTHCRDCYDLAFRIILYYVRDCASLEDFGRCEIWLQLAKDKSRWEWKWEWGSEFSLETGISLWQLKGL